jgi:hypothetical protein
MAKFMEYGLPAVGFWLEMIRELPRPGDYKAPDGCVVEIYGDWAVGRTCEEHREQVKAETEAHTKAEREKVRP